MTTLSIVIRIIEPSDNIQISNVIRTVLAEYGADKPGFAWQDPELDNMFLAYVEDCSRYWVVEVEGEIVGGVGIAPLVPEVQGTCELQKMYLLPKSRKLGIGQSLLIQALEFAQHHYKRCYLETISNMESAGALYQKYDFKTLTKPIIATEHSGCDRWYIKDF